jgi:glycosyltransferase involved in cell wall biosynthesis
MNILLATEIFPSYSNGVLKKTGGIEAHTFHIFSELADRLNKKINILCFSSNGREEIEEIRNLKILRVANYGPISIKHRRVPNPFTQLLFLKKMFKLVIKEKIDLIIAHGLFAIPSAIIVGKLLRKKVISCYHDVYKDITRSPFKSWMYLTGCPVKAILGRLLESLSLLWGSKSDAVLTVSTTTYKKLLKAGLSAKKVTIIGNGVDSHFIETPKEKENSIVFIGRLIPYKNIDVLIKAFSLVKSDIPDAKFHIIGEGPSRQKLQQLSVQLGVEDIVFHGYLDEARKEKILRSAKIICSASVVEGFGISVIEGMAKGATPVVSDIGAFRAIIGNFGALIEPYNYRQFAKYFKKYLLEKDVKKCKDMLAYLKKHWTWSNLVKKHLKVISNLK